MTRPPADQRRTRQLAILLALLAAIVAIVLPALAPYDPLQTVSRAELQLPSAAHLLGTDLLGRDVLSRLLFGARASLGMACVASLIALLPGAACGLFIAYPVGPGTGRIGFFFVMALQALLDGLLAFPGLLLAFVVIALIGNGPAQVAVAVGLSGIAPTARIARSAARSAAVQPYVEAAYAAGARRTWVLSRHVLPGSLTTLGRFAAVTFGWSLLNAAALTFLGFGGDPSLPEWGTMLAEGRQALRAQPFEALAAGAALTVAVYAANALAARLTGPRRW